MVKLNNNDSFVPQNDFKFANANIQYVFKLESAVCFDLMVSTNESIGIMAMDQSEALNHLRRPALKETGGTSNILLQFPVLCGQLSKHWG